MKTFQKFIAEMPQINTYHNKDRMSEYAEDVRNRIHNSSEKEEKLGNNIYRKNIENNHVYYNKDENSYPKEISIISRGNTHLFTHRGSGNTSTIHKFMLHHAKEYGSLQSDTSNTEGSKKLWTSLIQSNPKNKSFHTVNKYTREKKPLDSNTLNSNIDQIWGQSTKHSEIRLVMTHHDSK
jgi:hypothetical protein